MRQRDIARRLAGAALAALAATSAPAEPVSLKTLDGSFAVSGEIVDFDGAKFTIRTAVGNVTVAANLVICEGADCPDVEPALTEIAFAGDKTLSLRLLPELLRNFGDARGASTSIVDSSDEMLVLSLKGGTMSGEASVTILPTSSTSGIDALFTGGAEFALSSRPARSREVLAFQESGLGALRDEAQETIVALDGLVLVTHPENPVRAISEINAGLAFAGQIGNWSELGGRDAPIVLYVRDADSGSAEVFDTLLMRPAGLGTSAAAVVLDSDEAIADAVANDPNGIGYTGFASSGRAQALAVRGECGLQVPPTAFSIKTEEYPLTRLLYMYQTNKPLPTKAQAVREFITSPEAQPLIAGSGFIDQSITLESINAQGLRVASAVLSNATARELPQLREMIELLIASDRLSTTYRFETGSARLNARAEADIVRLAEILGNDRFANREVLFIGFTDSVGDAELNRQLSQQRAEQVLAALLRENPLLALDTPMSAIGYGEISPLGCNESNNGRLINRRVEVWVRDIVAADRG